MPRKSSCVIQPVLVSITLLALLVSLAAALGPDRPEADAATSSPIPAPATTGDPAAGPRAPILDANSRRISLQAMLTDGLGNPVSDGSHTLDVRFYDAEIGGVLIDSVLGGSVDTVNGIGSAQIGPVDPAVFNGAERWMSLALDGGGELSPRIPLTAVAYAFRANRVASEELDDFINLGTPTESGYLAIFGGQATPTFTVDASLNTLSLFSDDGTGSTGMFAESGGGYVTALNDNEIGAYLDGQGSVWAETSVVVGNIDSNFANNAEHAALQSGDNFGGRLLTWNLTDEITAMIGSSANLDSGGVLQLYRGDRGGLTVEIDGEDGNGNGRAIWLNADADTTVEISAQDHRVYTYGADDAEHARLGGSASGNLQLRAGGPSNPLTVNLNAGGGGLLDLYDAAGSDLGVRLEGGTSAAGGRVRVYNAGTNNTVDINGSFENSGAAAITLRGGTQDRILLDGANHRIQLFDPASTETVRMFGNGAGGGGGVSLRNSLGDVTVDIDGDDNNDSPALRVIHADGTNVFVVNAASRQAFLRGGVILAQNDAGQNTAELDGNANSSGVLRLRRADGTLGVFARATEGTGSELNLYNDAGQATVQIDTDWNGDGQSRIVANEVQITGGSDLAEQFDVAAAGAAEAGMIVCIDPDNPGKLAVCDSAYDRRVAGIISGANGVRTGMYMGQHGSEADGQLPVALTGRVYCHVDATYGPVRPGDLLTTSATPGFAMKVTDHSRAHGATIGKAMTGLAGGRGEVLVLVNLH